MYKKFPMHFKASPTIKHRAKILRRPLTAAENRFWFYVRNRGISGLKFRRQHPLGNFIADFYCHKLKLVVEIDGGIHDLKSIKEYDANREEIIKASGLTVIHFSNEDVFTNRDFIEREIRKVAERLNA